MLSFLFLIMTLGGSPELTHIAPLDMDANPARIADICYDGHKFIYISVMETGEIFVFDKTGKANRSVGKKGPGPDEFMWPHILDYSAPNLYVYDLIKLQIIKVNLETYVFEDEWKIDQINSFKINGNSIYSVFNQPQQGAIVSRSRLGKALEFSKFFYPDPGITHIPGGLYSAIQADGAGNIWVSHTGAYNISKYNRDGELLLQISKEPNGFVAPGDVRNDRKIDSNNHSVHFRSFDKSIKLFLTEKMVILHRMKHFENRHLDVYQLNGKPIKLGIPIPNLLPFAVENNYVLCLENTNAINEDAADLNLVKFKLPL